MYNVCLARHETVLDGEFLEVHQ